MEEATFHSTLTVFNQFQQTTSKTTFRAKYLFHVVETGLKDEPDTIGKSIQSWHTYTHKLTTSNVDVKRTVNIPAVEGRAHEEPWRSPWHHFEVHLVETFGSDGGVPWLGHAAKAEQVRNWEAQENSIKELSRQPPPNGRVHQNPDTMTLITAILFLFHALWTKLYQRNFHFGTTGQQQGPAHWKSITVPQLLDIRVTFATEAKFGSVK